MITVLAIMAACMPASTIDINMPLRLPIPYTQDYECPCNNSGRIDGIWLNYYSPCRCDDTIIVLVPLHTPTDFQPHPTLRYFDYYFDSLHYSVLAPPFSLIHSYYDLLDYRFLNRHILDLDVGDLDPAEFNDAGHLWVPTKFVMDTPTISITAAPAIVVPEPGTLALLVVGIAALGWRKKTI